MLFFVWTVILFDNVVNWTSLLEIKMVDLFLITLFFIVGLFLFIVGTTFLAWKYKRSQVIKKLLKTGKKIQTKAIGFDQKSFYINSSPTYKVETEYDNTDNGKKYTFTSEAFNLAQGIRLTLEEINVIDVYVKEEDYEVYYVDIPKWKRKYLDSHK